MRLPLILAAGIALAAPALASPAFAQDATGDWIGTVKTPAAELMITVHLQKGANGMLEGYAGSPEQTPNPLPMTDIAAADGGLIFSVPVVNAQYTGKWDPAAKAWVGTLTQAGYPMPLSLAAGKPPPRPTIVGLDGEWKGVLAVPNGDLHLVLSVKTGPDGTLALFASPDQGPQQAIAVVSRTGQDVSFQLKGLGGFDGKLSADGRTLDGEWRQGGGSLPLTMKKEG